ncbi:MAG: TlpA family protein disulfide reductase, partial [Gammaproteobacteria bacterium]|nr:TlpA family protein disulfide reductase [Gammaproteobacteria bacterium]
MKRSALVYTALALGAIAVAAVLWTGREGPGPGGGTGIAHLSEARGGEMRKLALHDTPQPLPEAVLLKMDGSETALPVDGKRYLLVNFWATWCAPCRAEMPMLDKLNADLGGDDFAVVLVAVGRNPPPAIEKFFAEAGITSLETLRDPQQRLSAGLGVMGLRSTILLTPEGAEIARMQGEADWASPEA